MDVIFWLTVVEAVVAGFMVIISGESFMPPTLAGFAAPAFLALAAQIGGQGLIIAGLGRTPAAIAGIIVLIQPVVAAAISWQLFDESLTAIQGGGAALILFVRTSPGDPHAHSLLHPCRGADRCRLRDLRRRN
jgi:drug/metabolite transporter (DMT)-like permease